MAGPRNDSDDRGNGGSSRGLFDDVKSQVIVALLAVIAGGGGAASFIGINDPRPDPFTGTMGRELEQRAIDREAVIWREISDIRRDDDVLIDRLQTHMVEAEKWKARIEVLERNCQDLMRRVREHEIDKR